MFGIDRDAVICDLAETYHVLDYRSLPIEILATLCAGLHSDSRIKMKLLDMKRIDPLFMFAHAADALTMILYSLTGEKKKPMLYQQVMTGKQDNDKPTGFDTIEEFEEAKKGFLKHV